MAAAIDLAVIVLPTIAVALITAERFTVIGPEGQPAAFSVVDQARLDAIDAGFHRAVELGGALFVLDLAGLLTTMATVALAAVLAHVVFPAAGGGRSPGKAVTGLRVVADDGGPAGIEQHLIRTLAGPIDLLGLGVPGLLGTLLAWGDVDRRRLGDRLAATRVTGRPAEWVVADPAPALAPAADQQPATPTSDAPTPAEVPVTILLTEPERTGPTTDRAMPQPVGEQPVPPAPPRHPVRRLDGSPTRSPQSRRGAIRAETETTIATATATTGSRPDAGWLGGDADYDEWAAPSTTASGDTTVGRGTRPIRSYNTLLFPESSLADISTAATVTGHRDEGDDLVIEPDDATKPMWDRGRQAWVYRNRADGRWFRHHDATGDWVPIARHQDS